MSNFFKTRLKAINGSTNELYDSVHYPVMAQLELLNRAGTFKPDDPAIQSATTVLMSVLQTTGALVSSANNQLQETSADSERPAFNA